MLCFTIVGLDHGRMVMSDGVQESSCIHGLVALLPAPIS